MTGRAAGAQLSGRALRERAATLASACVELQFERDPRLTQRYGEQGRRRCVEDATHHLRHLAEAVALGSARLFLDYLAWARELLEALRIPKQELRDQLVALCDALRADMDEADSAPAVAILSTALDSLDGPTKVSASHLESPDELAARARAYLQQLLDYQHATANRALLREVREGLPIEDLYLRILQPVLLEIGRLWQVGRIGVADEHYCTAAVQNAMAQLHGRIMATRPIGRRLAALCVGDELHDIGIRMVADLTALRGWETFYLGANVPLSAILDLVDKRRPHVVAISTTLASHLSDVELAVTALRGHRELGLRVLVGGQPFCTDGDLWHTLGADGSAGDALEAAKLADELAS